MTDNADVKEMLERRIETLYDEQENIITPYWNEVITMEKKRGGGKFRNRLRLRSIKDDNSVRSEWVGIGWVAKRIDGTFFEKKIHISKPANSFGYTMTKLFKFAHEWEKPIIWETETKLVGLRQELHHLTRALISIRHAENAEVKRQAKSDDENPYV